MKRKIVVLFMMMALLVFVTMQLQASSLFNKVDKKEIDVIIDEYV